MDFFKVMCYYRLAVLCTKKKGLLDCYVKSLYIIVEVMSDSLYGNSIRIRTTVHCTAV